MSRATRKIASYSWLVISLLLVAGTALWLYYENAQDRGRDLEQLRFRELSEIARGFESNLAGLNTLAREHRQVIAKNLGAIRQLRAEIARSMETLDPPDFQPTVPDPDEWQWLREGVLRAQSKLMLFDPQRCDDKGGDDVLAERLRGTADLDALRRLGGMMCEAGKFAVIPIAEFRIDAVKRLKEVRMLLATGCTGGSLTQGGDNRSTPPARTGCDQTAEPLSTLLFEGASRAKRIHGSVTAALEELEAWLDRLRCPADTMPCVAPASAQAREERLVQFVQQRITAFWQGEGDSFRIDTPEGRRELQSVMAGADRGQFDKAVWALDYLSGIVNGWYVSSDSPLKSSVAKYRLQVEFLADPEVDDTRVCSAPDDFARAFIFARPNTSIYASSNYNIGTCVIASRLAYSTPFAELLNPEADGRFAVVIVADSDGQVLYIHHNASADEKFVEVNVMHLLTKSARGEGTENGRSDAAGATGTLVSHSSIKTVDYVGVDHSAYVLPYQAVSGIRALADASEPLDQDRNQSSSASSGSARDASLKSLYFIGLIPERAVFKEQFRLPPGYYVTLTALGIAILLGIVFIKIKWNPLSAAFTVWDRRAATGAVVILTLVLFCGWVSWWSARSLHGDFRADAERSLAAISQALSREMAAILLTVDALLDDAYLRERLLASTPAPAPREPMATGTQCDKPLFPRRDAKDYGKRIPTGFGRALAAPVDLAGSRLGFGSPACRWHLKEIDSEFREGGARRSGAYVLSTPYRRYLNPQTLLAEFRDSHSVENIFTLTRDGRIRGELIRGSEKLVQLIDKPNLSARQYFRDAESGDVERWDLGSGASVPLAIERILSISNGSLTTQVAVSLDLMCADRPQRLPGFARLCTDRERMSGPAPPVLSFGVALDRLRTPPLPSSLQYAIIDTRVGTVLYHGRTRRSLVENFFEETEHNPALLQFIRAGPGGSVRGTDRAVFDGPYRGQRTSFYATHLDVGPDWALVVFRDREYAVAFATLHFTLSLLLCLSLMLFAALCVFVAARWRRDLMLWLWPRLDCRAYYLRQSRRLAGLGLLQCLLLFFLYGMRHESEGLIALAASPGFQVLAWLLLFVALAWHLPVSIKRHLYRPPGDRSRRGGRQSDDNRAATRAYALFISMLLLITAGIPAIGITSSVGYNLIHALEEYDALVFREKQTQRRGEFLEHYERRGNDEQYAAAADRQSRLAAWTAPERRILRRFDTVDASRHPPDPHFAGSLTWLFSLFSPAWQPAELVRTLLEDGEHKVYDTDAGWQLDYDYSGTTRSFLPHSPGTGSAVLTALAVLGAGAIIIYLAVAFVARYLLGTVVPISYRTSPRTRMLSWKSGPVPGSAQDEAVAMDSDYKHLCGDLAARRTDKGGAAVHALFVRPTHDSFRDGEGGDSRPLDLLPLVQRRLDGELSEEDPVSAGEDRTLVLTNIESVALDPRARMEVLEFLEELTQRPKGPSVVLLCEVSPLFMLTRQEEYVEGQPGMGAGAMEVARWSRLLSRFTKYYGWNPTQLDLSCERNAAKRTLLRELTAWPQLASLQCLADERLGERLEALSEEQVIQFVGAHAGSEYRRRWGTCTRAERLLLYQLANGLIINPKNIEPLEHLMRRGFVIRTPHWELANRSFARFVLSAEPASTFSEWIESADRGFWRLLRVPLVGFAVVILGIVVWSTQQELNAFVAVFGSILGLVPVVLRNIHLVKGSAETIS